MSETVETNNEFFKSNVLGHPAGLFVLFFTEMWERFSFYGMRVLLVNFLTMAVIGANPGWQWTTENAMALFGTYAGLLYLTPIVGGIIADKFIGYRWAVVVGALLMTAGHASMAIETEFSLYFGLGLLVIGTGFFKPTMTSIISEMYKDTPDKKDGAYTIFYMGVNAGAFFGMMLCGYLAERVGWSWGFGLAGVFMLLGTLQFWLSKPLFGLIGEIPSKIKAAKALEANDEVKEKEASNPNPFSKMDIILTVITSIIGLTYLLNDPLSKIAGVNMFNFELIGFSGQSVVVILGLILFTLLVFSRIFRYEKIVRDRMIAFVIFAFFTVFFWLSFEQGASSLILFARDSVDRIMTGGAATAYNVINGLLTIVPLGIITYVLFLLWKRTYKKIPGSNIVLALCFALMWGVVGWMLNRDFNTKSYEVSYNYFNKEVINEDGDKVLEKNIVAETGSVDLNNVSIYADTVTIGEQAMFAVGDRINILHKNNQKTEFSYLDNIALEKAINNAKERGLNSEVVSAQVIRLKGNEVEIPVSWFSILNSFFIIAFASLFSKWWESKYNPSAVGKYALGLIIMAFGFGLLAFGSYEIQEGVKVSMIWLVLAYLFHTLGELCLSPVGLSYVSKLVPARMIAFMFGMWYLAIAIGNKLAHVLGGQIENITREYSLSAFFLIFTIVPLVAGLMILVLNPLMKKLMHGVK